MVGRGVENQGESAPAVFEEMACFHGESSRTGGIIDAGGRRISAVISLSM